MADHIRRVGRVGPGLLLLLGFLTGCSTMPAQAPLQTVRSVDLPRFMGDWYIIASIPTFIEKDAYAGIESYALNADGTVDTTFTFRKGSLDGPQKRYTPKGFIVDSQTNATWGMRFIWPIKAEYLILDLAPDYSTTIIGRNKRDYLWIMARTPLLPDEQYAALVRKAEGFGYDASLIRKVPQRAP
ncbi:MAG: lipocalin family protein [Steroidobacteraceae bacterium]